MLNQFDIDWDEGRDWPEPFATFADPCENCGEPVHGNRIWIPGFEFWACDDCAEESSILYFAEENCPVLYDAIMRAKSIQQVRNAFAEHKSSCPKCNPAIRKGPKSAPRIEDQEERAA